MPEFLNDYGCVIVDECHHVGAFNFERILKFVKSKFVYGLTATAFRRDGHDKIIFMQCGPVRFKTETKEISASHGFDHFFIPRFVPFVPIENPNDKNSISDYYKFITENSNRTKLICNDVCEAVQNSKTPIIISERIKHLLFIEAELKNKNAAQNIIVITGQGTSKQKNEILAKLNSIPPNETLIVLATGKYIGEGFDNPRLDSLFLTMPISWKGLVDQYTGRLHRKFENKTSVYIYDYIDFRIPQLERMSHKRMKEYKKLGYMPKSFGYDSNEKNIAPKIYSGMEFKTDLYESLKNAKKSIIISSQYLNKYESLKFSALISSKITSGVKVFITTKKLSENPSEKNAKNYFDTLLTLKNCGCSIIEKENISQRFAIIDEEIIWFGSANLLGYISEDDCIMRICNAELAAEIIGTK